MLCTTIEPRLCIAELSGLGLHAIEWQQSFHGDPCITKGIGLMAVTC